MAELNGEMAQREIYPWHAAYTRHQHEKCVADGLVGRGVEVFLPVYDAVRRWHDRQKRLSLPLFPCYVFFRSDAARRMKVLSTPGVHSIVGFGGQPAVIEKCQIDAIRAAVESRLPIEPHPFLRCGDRIRVKFGPLAGVEGILTRKRGFTRLVLSADLLQQSISVEVGAECIEKIGSGESFATAHAL